MPRPLTGQIDQLASGRWQVSVPEVKGSRKRRYETFDTWEEADAWRILAVACVNCGAPIPSCDSTAHWLEDVARRWHHRVYRVQQRAQPGRGDQVLRQIEMYILPWFTSRWKTPNDTLAIHCHEFMLFLAGRCDIDGNVTLGAAAADQVAISEATAGGIHRVLFSILEQAVDERILDRNVAVSSDAAKPTGASHKRQPSTATAVPLRDAAKVASDLHALHQMALWFQRIGGPRVGEAYGPRVGEIIRDGAHGIYVVDSQGGRNFEFWNELGERELATHIEKLKNSTSYRIMVLCPALMELVELIEEAFHTNPDGSLNIGVPLIPGIHAMDGGADGYCTALKVSAQGVFEHSDSLSSHDLRKGLCMDLEHSMDISYVLQRRIAGHAAGNDVHGRIYILDHPDLVKLKDAADQTERLIRAEIGSLIVPTTRMPAFARDHPLYDRLGTAADVLRRAGLLIDKGHRLSTADVAARIGRAETTTRRLIERGVIAGTKVRSAAGVDAWEVEPDAVESYLASYDGFVTVEEAADRIGVTDAQLYRLIKRLGIEPPVDPVSNRKLIDENCIAEVAGELGRISALQTRSMVVADAARLLGRPRTSIQPWVGPRLDRDPETDATGAVYVTRDSVERLRVEMATAPKRPKRLPGR